MRKSELKRVIQEELNKIQEQEKWMQKAFSKHKGALHKQLGVPEDETIPMTTINQELANLHSKTEKGEKLTKSELTFFRRLQVAKNARK